MTISRMLYTQHRRHEWFQQAIIGSMACGCILSLVNGGPDMGASSVSRIATGVLVLLIVAVGVLVGMTGSAVAQPSDFR